MQDSGSSWPLASRCSRRRRPRTWDRLLATVQQLNRLGKRSVEAGFGPAYFHNHKDEFSRRYTDFGRSCPTTEVNTACKSSWEIIMERTDPRWVVAQIDIGWAVCGSALRPPPPPHPRGGHRA